MELKNAPELRQSLEELQGLMKQRNELIKQHDDLSPKQPNPSWVVKQKKTEEQYKKRSPHP